MSWRELPRTADLLRAVGLGVKSVWSPSQNEVPRAIFVFWTHEPEPHERDLVAHYAPANTIRHYAEGAALPSGCPWA